MRDAIKDTNELRRAGGKTAADDRLSVGRVVRPVSFELTASLVRAHAWLWIAACYRLGGSLSAHVYDRRA